MKSIEIINGWECLVETNGIHKSVRQLRKVEQPKKKFRKEKEDEDIS